MRRGGKRCAQCDAALWLNPKWVGYDLCGDCKSKRAALIGKLATQQLQLGPNSAETREIAACKRFRYVLNSDYYGRRRYCAICGKPPSSHTDTDGFEDTREIAGKGGE